MRKELSGFIRDAVNRETVRAMHLATRTDFDSVADDVLERMDELTLACSQEVLPGELALWEGQPNG